MDRLAFRNFSLGLWFAACVCWINRYVLFDTQVALEMCRRGSSDFLMHSIQFYIDLLGIFTRIAQILVEKDERAPRRKREDRDE